MKEKCKHDRIKETETLNSVSFFYFTDAERMDGMELKEKILETTIKVFNKKGVKLTMDDIANELSISKKTIYTVFKDKEEMCYEMVDYCFDRIKESEEMILNDESLSTVEKIRAILLVLPDGYKDIDFRQLYILQDKFPRVYKKIQKRLETGWEGTIELLKQGIKEGCIRPCNITVFKIMVEAIVEQFIQRDVLIVNQISYTDALDEVLNILLDGITENKERLEG